MGRLNQNQNQNQNQSATLPAGIFSSGVRYNSADYGKMLKADQFPVKSSQAVLDAVNGVKFREFWDAELRASVYLNEFISKNPTWLSTLTDAIDTMGLYKRLQDEKDEQLKEVIDFAVDREERFAEILDQHDADGAIKYWLGMLMIDPASAPATNQLIRVARRIGEVLVMCLKEHYGEARPSQVCPAILPLIDPPNHPSFPSGHAMQSHLISRCLKAAGWAPHQTDLLFVLSKRVAENRVIAGLHYPLDNDAGVLAADTCFAMLTKKADPGKPESSFQRLLTRAQAESQAKAPPREA